MRRRVVGRVAEVVDGQLVLPAWVREADVANVVQPLHAVTPVHEAALTGTAARTGALAAVAPVHTLVAEGQPSLLDEALSLPDQPTLWLAPETIVESGGSVTDWTGYQGTSIDLEQTTGANRPAYIASEAALGNQPCVHRDTTTKWLQEVTSGALGNLTDCTMFVVAQVGAQSTGVSSMELLSSGGTTLQMSLASDPGSGTDYRSLYVGTHTHIGPANTDGQIACNVFDATAGTVTEFENGIALGATSYGGSIPFGTTGEKVFHGANGGAHGANSKTAEIIIIPAALSDAHREVWEAYLADKYGLTLASPLPEVVDDLRRAGKVNSIFLGDYGTSIDTGVETWTDQGPWGREVANATGSEQPTVITGQGSRDALRFDGSDDYLEGTWAMNKPQRVFSVAVLSRSAKDSSAGWDGYNPWLLLDTFIGTDGCRMFGGSDNLTFAAATYPRDEVHLFDCHFTGASSTMSFAVDGDTPVTGNDNGANDPSGLTVGAFSSVTVFGDTDVSCIVVYESVVGDPYTILSDYYGL